MAALAILPVHAIYAGFVLRESLVALMSILAVWTLCEVFHAEPERAGHLGVGCRGRSMRRAWPSSHARRRWRCWRPPACSHSSCTVEKGSDLSCLWAAIAGLVCLPWAWRTLQEYGSPFYSYTSFFEYNFSWTIHHYDKGNTLPSQFYTLANLPEIVRIKVKSLLLIVVYSTMIVGLPFVLGFCRRLGRRSGPGRETDLLVATIFVVFVLATLKSIADVTQVAQLGRYYLPVFALGVARGRRGTARMDGFVR